MPVKFSEREMQNAVLAYTVHVGLRPTCEESYMLYTEIAEHLPPLYAASVLGTTVTALRRWDKEKRVPQGFQRLIHLLHLTMFQPGESNLFRFVAWDKLPPFTPATQPSKLENLIMSLFIELGDIAPHRVMPLLRGRCKASEAVLEATCQRMFENNQLTRHPVTGNWKPDRRSALAWRLRQEQQRQEREHKIVQMPAA